MKPLFRLTAQTHLSEYPNVSGYKENFGDVLKGWLKSDFYRCVFVLKLWPLMLYFKASFVTVTARCTTAMSNPERMKCNRIIRAVYSEHQSKNNHAKVTICWHHDCLEDKVVDFSFSCFCCWKACVFSYTQNSNQIICKINVRTVCLKELMWGTKSDFPAVWI